MDLQVPFSRAYMLLLLALPGVWWLARALAHAVTRDLGLRAVLPIGVAIALELLGVHLASLASGTLYVGLPAGTLALAAAGVFAERARRSRGDTEPTSGRHPSPWMLITAAATALAIAPAALRFWFHDELLPTGHLSIAAELQNGIYPPRHLAFPDLPLRYHFGFDLFSACLTAFFHVPVDRAVDVNALLLWCASWCLLWALGERLLGRGRAWLTPVLVLFGGGAPFGCEVPGPSIVYRALVECRIGRKFSANAPVTSYFFQHPWSLGIPLAITAILLFSERDAHGIGGSRRARARLLAVGIALAALSLGEIVLFAGLVPALVVAEVWRDGTRDLRRAGPLLGVAALSVGAARLLGGFFASAPEIHPLGFELHSGFTNDARTTLIWNAQTFGVLPLLGALGLFVPSEARLLLFLLAAGSMVVVNAVRFLGTEDIMKFATLGVIALGILASAAIARLLPPRGEPRPAPLRTTAAAALTACATAWGWLFVLFFALDLGDIQAVLRKGPETLAPDDVAAVTFVRQRVRAGEIVFRNQRASLGYAQWGGLPQPWLNWTDWSFGLAPARLQARERLLRDPRDDANVYRAQGFHWFVLAPEDARLRGIADAWIGQGAARLAATFGALRVVELLPG